MGPFKMQVFFKLIIVCLVLPLAVGAKEVVISTVDLEPYPQEFLYLDLYLANERSTKSIEYGDTVVLQWRDRFRLGFKGRDIVERRVRVGKLLGEGAVSKVYEILDEPSRVLRIPINWSYYRKPHIQTPDFIDQTYLGAKVLETHGFPIVHIHEYQKFLYLIVDRVDGPTMKDFIFHPELFTTEEGLRMNSDLMKFVGQTADFSFVGDFKYDQAVYDADRGWVLIDWSQGSVFRRWRSGASSFLINNSDVTSLFSSPAGEAFYWKVKQRLQARSKKPKADFCIPHLRSFKTLLKEKKPSLPP
jgi:hypothetical protein